MLKFFRNFFCGLVFGITQILPGVSGGTIAVVLGFYFEMISAINTLFKELKRNLLFLVPLILGMAVGLVAFSSLVEYLISNYSFPTMLFIMGLIMGVLPHVFAKVNEGSSGMKLRYVLSAAVPLVILLGISFLSVPGSRSPAALIAAIDLPYMAYLFLAGFLAAAALIIPGFSGSFILLLLGVFHLAIYSLSSIRIWLGDLGNLNLLLDIAKVMVPLGLGVIVGVLAMAKVIGNLLLNHGKLVYSIILGLIIGSICVLVQDPIIMQSGFSFLLAVIGIFSFCLGTILSYALGRRRL